MPPGVETWGFVENLSAFLQRRYRHDHLLAALRPLGRGLRHEREGARPGCRRSQVAGKVGYAMPPGGHPELAAGFALSVSAN